MQDSNDILAGLSELSVSSAHVINIHWLLHFFSFQGVLGHRGDKGYIISRGQGGGGGGRRVQRGDNGLYISYVTMNNV